MRALNAILLVINIAMVMVNAWNVHAHYEIIATAKAIAATCGRSFGI